MTTKLSRFCEAIIEAGSLAALIYVPLFFNVHSSRVFEPDKISVLRSIALVMVIAWLIKYISANSYMPFVIYRIVLGVVVLILCAAGVLDPTPATA